MIADYDKNEVNEKRYIFVVQFISDLVMHALKIFPVLFFIFVIDFKTKLLI